MKKFSKKSFLMLALLGISAMSVPQNLCGMWRVLSEVLGGGDEDKTPAQEPQKKKARKDGKEVTVEDIKREAERLIEKFNVNVDKLLTETLKKINTLNKKSIDLKGQVVTPKHIEDGLKEMKPESFYYFRGWFLQRATNLEITTFVPVGKLINDVKDIKPASAGGFAQIATQAAIRTAAGAFGINIDELGVDITTIQQLAPFGIKLAKDNTDLVKMRVKQVVSVAGSIKAYKKAHKKELKVIRDSRGYGDSSDEEAANGLLQDGVALIDSIPSSSSSSSNSSSSSSSSSSSRSSQAYDNDTIAIMISTDDNYAANKEAILEQLGNPKNSLEKTNNALTFFGINNVRFSSSEQISQVLSLIRGQK